MKLSKTTKITNKKADLFHSWTIQIIIIGILFALFFLVTADKINARGLKQQIIEKQTALLINSAEPGMNLTITKANLHGHINKIEIKKGNIHININGLPSIKGQPYITKNKITLTEKEKEYTISIT